MTTSTLIRLMLAFAQLITAIAQLIRTRVLAETGLAISIGVASTKFLAKLSSDLAKPDGVLVVPAVAGGRAGCVPSLREPGFSGEMSSSTPPDRPPDEEPPGGS